MRTVATTHGRVCEDCATDLGEAGDGVTILVGPATCTRCGEDGTGYRPVAGTCDLCEDTIGNCDDPEWHRSTGWITK